MSQQHPPTADPISWSCPVPDNDQELVTLAHGGGGALTHRLIDDMIKPAFDNTWLSADHDSAVVDVSQTRLAFTTDSFVVQPCFFPGGNIGSLAVHGTVNDLAMSGARPQFLSAALILEEGFPMVDLERVIHSMSSAARLAGVSLVTGDTKVVDKGHGDGLYINTSGLGVIEHSLTIGPQAIEPGDVILVSGDLGRHGIAIMSVREGLQFENPVQTDSAPVNHIVQALFDEAVPVHCLRDPTRGGVATTLVELARSASLGMELDEVALPILDEVRGACEILGLDPLYVANEGRFLAIVPASAAELCLTIMHRFESCQHATRIGQVIERHPGRLSANTPIGGSRALDMLSGEQLPRIC